MDMHNRGVIFAKKIITIIRNETCAFCNATRVPTAQGNKQLLCIVGFKCLPYRDGSLIKDFIVSVDSVVWNDSKTI